jgi:hypothetical protein
VDPAAAFACGSPTGPSAAGRLSETLETLSFVFRFSTGDAVDPSWQQAFSDWVVVALDVRVPQRLVYNKYRNRAQLGDLTGHVGTNGFAEPASFTLHTIWPYDNHEVTHVYVGLFGHPVALFDEGIAVAHQIDPTGGDFTPRWSGIEPHDWAKTFRRDGRLAPLDRMLATADFRLLDANVTYPEAGSFVRFLLDTYGLDRLKQLVGGESMDDTADTVRRQFQAVYDRAIANVERDWWAMIDAR